MKQMGHTKKIIVLASPNVQQNFHDTYNYLMKENWNKSISNKTTNDKYMEYGIWNIESCVGNQL